MAIGGSFLKRLLTLALTGVLLGACPTMLLAQTTPKRRTPVKKKTPAETPKPAPSNFVAEAQQVGVQIVNVSKFLFVYGKIVNSLQVADDLSARGEVTPAIAEKNKQSKAALVTTINGLRSGIDKLAASLSGNTRTQIFGLKLGPASDSVRDAEQLAAAGKYDDAGKSLMLSVEKLTDVMAAMR
jgi:hypothetical protein